VATGDVLATYCRWPALRLPPSALLSSGAHRCRPADGDAGPEGLARPTRARVSAPPGAWGACSDPRRCTDRARTHPPPRCEAGGWGPVCRGPGEEKCSL